MNFLKKLFGSKQPTSTTPTMDSFQSNPKQTLSDFFKVDIINIPDSTFSRGQDKINSDGLTVEHYQKILDYFECGLFNVIEIVKCENGSKNVIFRNYDLNSINLSYVKKLINDLYLINGPDEYGRGTFNSMDKEWFYSTEFDVLFGRIWSTLEKYKYPLFLSISRDTNDISLTIWYD